MRKEINRHKAIKCPRNKKEIDTMPAELKRKSFAISFHSPITREKAMEYINGALLFQSA